MLRSTTPSSPTSSTTSSTSTRWGSSSPGYVWRLQTDEGDATAVRAFDDPLMILNLTVWASVEALGDFVYRSGHLAFLRRKREWFERAVEAHLVMWWVPAGHLPTVEEALDRLEDLRSNGASAAGVHVPVAAGRRRAPTPTPTPTPTRCRARRRRAQRLPGLSLS